MLLIQTMCVCLYVFGLAGKTVHTKQQTCRLKVGSARPVPGGGGGYGS